MAIARVQDAAFDHDTGSTGAWTVTLGGAPTSGNVLYAVTAVIGASVTWTPPSGWTSIKAENGNSNINVTLWRKVAGGSEPSSYAWTPSIGAKGYAWVGEYSGVDTTTPEDATPTSNTNQSNVTTVTTTITVATANAWTITAGIGRHAFTGSAQALSTSDGSDSSRHSHGSNGGSGFDFSGRIWDSGRTLSAGADAATLTSNTTEGAMSCVEVALRPAGAALTAGVYQSYITAPQAAPALRAGIYQSYITAPAASGGLTAGIYESYITAPLPAGSPGQSGVYIADGGNLVPVIVYIAADGEV